MSTVQKLCDDSGAARRPGTCAIHLDESWRHHVVVLQFPKHVLTGPHVVMWHVEHVPFWHRTGSRMKHGSTDVSWKNERRDIPSSWAAVKAEGKPSSSITEQLLFGSHIVPTSARPRVSQVEAPQRSWSETTFTRGVYLSKKTHKNRCKLNF